MLSLIVALPTLGDSPGESLGNASASSGHYRYALSRDAAHTLTRLSASEDGTDAALADHGSTALALLPRADELVAVVPAQLLSWHRVTLPRVPAARVRAALDGILEDRLLDEPGQLHFALQPAWAAGSPVWVAACDKAWLQQALQIFETAGRPVTRIVPQFAPVPNDAPPVYYASGSAEQAWLTRCASDGVQRLPLAHSTVSALGLDVNTSATANTGANTQAHWVAEPAVAALAEQLLGSKMRVRHSAQSLVAAARSGWDLAQFDLASTGRTRFARSAAMAWAQASGSPAWRPARWGLAALVAVQLVGLNAWAWRERNELAAKRTQVRELLTKTFPKIPLVVDAPVQMERELTALRQATGALSARDLEPMLAAMAQAAPGAKPPTAMEFAPGELTLKGLQATSEQASAWESALNRAGLSAQRTGEAWTLRPTSSAVPVRSAGAAP